MRTILQGILLALFCTASYAEGLIYKSGFYSSLGFYTGYYHYGEIGRDSSRVMRMDTAMFGLSGQLGSVTSFGLKLEGTARFNYALGVYTGGILDTDNDSRNGRKLQQPTGAIAGDVELKVGYDFLHFVPTSSLFLQSGVGYHANRTEVIPMTRFQGYFYLPIELDGHSQISQNLAISYGGGYRYLIFGNHFSASTRYGFTDDYSVLQHDGFGALAYIGANFLTKDGGMRSVRLVYEYWSIEAADAMRTTSIYTGKPTALYEPKNSTHRVFLQYSFGF